MSSYFDERQRIVRENFDCIADVEEEVKRDVLLIAGDSETPEGIRDAIVNTVHGFAFQLVTGPTKGTETSKMMHISQLISELHILFHDIAKKRVQTRFGGLSDKPDCILARRNKYIREHVK